MNDICDPNNVYWGQRSSFFQDHAVLIKYQIKLKQLHLRPTRVSGAGLVLAPHNEVLLPTGPGDGHQDAEGVQLPHPLLVAVLLLPDAPVRRGPADVLEYVELLVPGDAAITLGLHQVLRYVGELLRYSPFGVQCFISFTTLNESSSDENCFDNEKRDFVTNCLETKHCLV